MKNKKLGRRYAVALGDLAREKGVLDQVVEEFKAVVETLESSSHFQRILTHQQVSPDRKRQLIADTFGPSLSQVMRNFLYLVVEKRREAFLTDMYEEFVGYSDQLRNVAAVEVTVARPMSDEERERMKQRFDSLTGKTVRLTVKEDPSIIGGVRARVGDMVMDGSAVGKLKRLKASLRNVHMETGDLDNAG